MREISRHSLWSGPKIGCVELYGLGPGGKAIQDGAIHIIDDRDRSTSNGQMWQHLR